MNELLLYIIIFFCVYMMDMLTALLHRKMRPNNFKKTEANERFRKCLEQKGVLKGIGAYIVLSLTETIMLFIAVLFAANIIFDSTIIMGLMFAFLLLAIFHILGAITNLIALLRRDVKPKQPMINVNNMNIKRDVMRVIPKEIIPKPKPRMSTEDIERNILAENTHYQHKGWIKDEHLI